jgi:HEAT repeat protein
MRNLLVLLVVGALAGCGKEKEPVTSHGKPVSHWLDALKDPDPARRKKAVKALGHVGISDPAAVQAVSGALKDEDAGVRAQAALALLYLGPAAKDAVPDLEQAQGDPDPTVQTYARKALDQVRGD